MPKNNLILDKYKLQYEDLPSTPQAKRVATIKKKRGDKAFARWGKKGGAKKTNKLRGWAYLKEYKPEYYQELIARRKRK